MGEGFDQDDLKYGFGKLNIYPNEFNLKLFMKSMTYKKRVLFHMQIFMI